MKTCNICGATKDGVDFYKNGKFRRPECKPCTLLKQTSARFGLTVDELLEMYKAQDGKCAICNKECSIYANLSVDHDHRCCPEKGKSCGNCVRGLLCAHCNHAIGLFGESLEVLQSATDYLRKHGR